jgi:hypothetical protein
MRFRLRTLLMLAILGPPALAGCWRLWPQVVARYDAWRWRHAIAAARNISMPRSGFTPDDCPDRYQGPYDIDLWTNKPTSELTP